MSILHAPHLTRPTLARHTRSQLALPPARALHRITAREFTCMCHTGSQSLGPTLLLIYSPIPNHILQASSQASNPSSGFRRKRKEKRSSPNKPLHAHHALCRDWCANLIIAHVVSSFSFFFLAPSWPLVGSLPTASTGNRPSGLIIFLFMARSRPLFSFWPVVGPFKKNGSFIF